MAERVANQVKENTIQEEIDAFLRGFKDSTTASVSLERRTFPINSHISYPDADIGIQLAYVPQILEVDLDVASLFEVNGRRTHYTGYMAKGARQTIANAVGKPILFTTSHTTVDEREYTEWSVVYPDVEPSTPNHWQIEMGENQAILKPDSLKITNSPSQVRIPNHPYVFERSMNSAVDMFQPETVENRVNSIGLRQLNMSFDVHEVRDGLTRTMKAIGVKETMRGKHIDIPGAYVGKFAELMANMGFRVRASDVLLPYVEGLKERGLEARQIFAQRLPKMSEGKFATICFELYPLVESETFYMAMIRELMRSQAGIIFVEKKDCSLDTYVAKVNRDQNPYHTEIDAYSNFAQIYGLNVNVVDTQDLRFISLAKATEQQRETMYQDLKVMYALRRAITNGNLYGHKLGNGTHDGLNRVYDMPVDVSQLAKHFILPKQELIASLNRIDRGHSALTHEFGEGMNQEDREKGGPLNVLRIAK